MQRILFSGVLVALFCGVMAYQVSQQHHLERAQGRANAVVEQVYLRSLREYYQYLYDVQHQRQQQLLTRHIPTGAITPYLSNHVAVVDVEQWVARQTASVSPYSIVQLNLSTLQGSWWPEHALSSEVRLLITFENSEGYQQLWALHDWLQRLFMDAGIAEPEFRVESVHSQLASLAFQQPIVFPDFLLPQLQLVVEQKDLIARFYPTSTPWLWAVAVILLIMTLTMGVLLVRLLSTRAVGSVVEATVTPPAAVAPSSKTGSTGTALLSAMERQERLASLGEMTSGILHEINNPLAYLHSNLTELDRDLTALMNFIAYLDDASDLLDIKSDFYQKLLTQYQSLDIQQVLEIAPQRLSDCRKGVQSMQRIIDDMRRVGRQMAEKSVQPLNPSIESAINIARNKLPSQVQLTVTLIDVPSLYCNASQISQVVVNLLVNAMQALKEGGHIGLEQRLTEHELCISVFDDGPGMSEEVAARIFDPFFTTKSDTEGSGLGLSICQKVVQQHGGRIELTTAVGQGARFDVYLPLVVDES